MTAKKTRQIKVCNKCGKYEFDSEDNKIVTFEKGRNTCRICRNRYHKNRREDLKDGERNEFDWYKYHGEMTNARILKKLQLKVDTKLPKIQVDIIDESETPTNRKIFYTFVITVLVIVYIVFDSLKLL